MYLNTNKLKYASEIYEQTLIHVQTEWGKTPLIDPFHLQGNMVNMLKALVEAFSQNNYIQNQKLKK